MYSKLKKGSSRLTNFYVQGLLPKGTINHHQWLSKTDCRQTLKYTAQPTTAAVAFLNKPASISIKTCIFKAPLWPNLSSFLAFKSSLNFYNHSFFNSSSTVPSLLKSHNCHTSKLFSTHSKVCGGLQVLLLFLGHVQRANFLVHQKPFGQECRQLPGLLFFNKLRPKCKVC